MKFAAPLALAVVFTLQPAHAQEELRFGNWPGYYPLELLKKFKKETGINVTLTAYDSDAAVTTKMKAGGSDYDVVIVSDLYVAMLSKQQLLEKLDKAKLPNSKNIRPDYAHPVGDTNRDYGMPYQVITTGLVYDTSRVPGGVLPDSWKTFFEPPEYLKGKIVALNVQEELYMAASWYLGQDECSENPQDAKRVLSVLLKQKPYLLAYANDGVVERFQSKQVVLNHDWSADAAKYHKVLPMIVFMYPKEGVHEYVDNFVIPAAAKNRTNAYKFIDWMMEPRNIAEASNFNRYHDAIIGSTQFLTAELQKDPTINPPAEFRKRLKPMKICSPAAMSLRDKVWVKLKG
ncbi:spermidine/putrescine ABC transporter substrate-binding protein [Burkholderia mayonis]|uniref:Putrescine-binding periplasmic protein n=1 Tax=Burkholderia mayonis TaxID=1385591 RepID=A0A1B4FLU3_9BURK|nr:extracellular solute-binding protein [Burkholderia mayonis]AOJ04626.1 spermidine/putrescine ABC transporter substrate-binding protein [Burkholderia mayonis]KVE40914.1 spermidine/putrescine ABC transporter substrate-binding protein [Burkholderia mayonis]